MPKTKTSFFKASTSSRDEGLFRLLLLAVVVIGLTAIYITWPRAVDRDSRGRAPVYYNAPTQAGEVAGNPKIEPVVVGAQPSGFPTDLPLYEKESIVQAYRSQYPNEDSFHTAVVFYTNKSVSDVLAYYNEWLTDRTWTTQLQPKTKPHTVYATSGNKSILVNAFRDSNDQTLVSVSYAQQ